MKDEYLTTREAAMKLNCSTNTILNWIKNGKIVFIKEKYGLTRFIYKVSMKSVYKLINRKNEE